MITSSDESYGDFLLNHWLVSLKDNVDLSNIDVIVIDYGLTEEQRQILQTKGIHCHPSEKDGNITNIRYRDIARVLDQGQYDQVMSVDGGDIIFQDDIRHLFDIHRDRFRAVCEELHVPLHELVLPRKDISRDNFIKIFYFLKGKPRINGGVILGPSELFRDLWEQYREMTEGYQVFGTDQYIMNYLLYKRGFVRLENRYNFVVLSMNSPFSIRKGAFYDGKAKLIPIVHNAGWRNLTRCIRRFGYGEDRNQLKPISYHAMRLFFKNVNRVNMYRGYY